jgi:hypothetical protein
MSELVDADSAADRNVLHYGRERYTLTGRICRACPAACPAAAAATAIPTVLSGETVLTAEVLCGGSWKS